MAGVYLIEKDGNLVELQERPYNAEAELQELLARYPSLLPGDQVDAAEPRRWLLIAREAGLPSEEDGTDRWSVDHLFIDQDGVPTIVEVKRSSDTRIRREVVGQMLDYAANGVKYWSVETLQSQFEDRCNNQKTPVDPTQELETFLVTGEEDSDRVDAFWLKVKDNLRLGRIRMIFVADEIPLELRRIVEFLNEQMDPAEVLAVEVRQFANDSVKTLVPRLFGQTVTAQDKKGPRSTRQWDEASFFEDLEKRQGEPEAAVCRDIFDWSIRRGLKIEWGKGSQKGSFLVRIQTGHATYNLFNVYSSGRIALPLRRLKRTPPFDADEKRLELVKRLNTIPGVELERDDIEKWPRISLSILARNSAVAKLFDAFEWTIGEATRIGTGADHS